MAHKRLWKEAEKILSSGDEVRRFVPLRFPFEPNKSSPTSNNQVFHDGVRVRYHDEGEPADLVCLSKTHDRDYEELLLSPRPIQGVLEQGIS
jgi:hypothetical protein